MNDLRAEKITFVRLMKVWTGFLRMISVVFQPIFMLFYCSIILICANPYIFQVEKGMTLILIFIYSIIFPAVSILLLRGTNLISSLSIPNRKERIVPYVLCGIFYLWFFINILRNPDFPVELSVLVLGTTIALFSCFFINNFDKISLHSAGGGLLVASVFMIMSEFTADKMLLLFSNEKGFFQVDLFFVFILSIIVAGLIGESRLHLKAHDAKQVYAGFVIGVLSIIISTIILI